MTVRLVSIDSTPHPSTRAAPLADLDAVVIAQVIDAIERQHDAPRSGQHLDGEAIGLSAGMVGTSTTNHAEKLIIDADARAIATYLLGIPAKEQDSGPAPSQEQLAAGEITYTVHCGSCHLPTGLGDKGMGVTLAGNSIVQAADPSSLINVVLYGPRLPPPFVSDRTRMKQFGKRLSDEDIANLTTYVRTNFGNQAGAVSTAQVKRQR